MADDQKENIIIIKKIYAHGGHHGGAWKVAYADFVTAMMALFMVLWLLSSSAEVQKAVGGYFQDPTGDGKLMGSQMSGAGGASVNLDEDDMAKLKEKINSAMKEMSSFQQFKDNVKMIVTGEGLRIELIEKEHGMFFESGKGHPSESGKDLIAKLAVEIGKLPNKVLIEGHTDSNAFSGAYSNWELSADRANEARKVMMENGMRPDQVAQIRGFADQHLRIPDDPENPGNRRVSIIIQYRDEIQGPPISAEEAEKSLEGAAQGAKDAPKGHGAPKAKKGH